MATYYSNQYSPANASVAPRRPAGPPAPAPKPQAVPFVNYSPAKLFTPAPQVQGASSDRSSGGSSSGGSSSRSQSVSRGPSAAEIAAAEARAAEDRLRGEISSGWDSYIKGLDDQLAGLDPQRAAQEEIVNSQYNQGVGNLGLQLEQGTQALSADRESAQRNQAANLRDISGSIRNAFQAGNVYLGSRGAGDSSAANQYSYALNKMGTQQRSDVMSDTASILADVDARETNLKNIYNTEVNNLGQQKNAQIQQVAMWFADAQNQVRQAQSQGRLNKSQDLASLSKDLLNQALAKVSQIEQMSNNRKQALDQWAMGISTNINELKSNMRGVADVNYDLPRAGNVVGTPTVDSSGNMFTGYGAGSMFSREDDRNRLFR